MAEEHGYAGRILEVDLSSGSTSSRPTADYADAFLGCRGIGTKIYWDEVPPEAKAFDPENRLIFVTGPATGYLRQALSAKFMASHRLPVPRGSVTAP